MRYQLYIPSLLFSTTSILVISANLFLNLTVDSSTSIFIALILISTIGIYHGAFDINKGSHICKKLNLKPYKFNLVYILLSLTIVVLWAYFPISLITVFLLLSAHHFGSEEYLYYKFKSNLIPSVLRGFLVLILPITFHFNETIYIFKTINIRLENPAIFALESNYIVLAVIIFANFIFSLSKQSNIQFNRIMINMDMFILVLLNYLIEPLAAFTIYFCFLHSARNIYKVDNTLRKSILSSNKQVLNISYLTCLIFLIVFSTLYMLADLSASAYNTIFIGLAALTFPHIATDIAFNRLSYRIKSS
tara:strand:- start:2876 stop:3790 length:915 start_codon:yes stop_codon:yes gene_type:complete